MKMKKWAKQHEQQGLYGPCLLTRRRLVVLKKFLGEFSADENVEENVLQRCTLKQEAVIILDLL